MNDAERVTLIQIQELLSGSRNIEFEMGSRSDRHLLLCRVLRELDYGFLERREKGMVRQYLVKLSGLGRAQVTRLIHQWRETGGIAEGDQRRARFARRYTNADIALLVKADEAHGQLSGPAMRHILQREYSEFGHQEFQRLSGISASHLYNLRRGKYYQERHVTMEATKPVVSQWGERRKPEPNGKPGYLRVDTVHQGRIREQDGGMGHGIYHINAVDTVTQWEIVGCVKELTKIQLAAVLASMMEQYPFPLLGLHFDNGSEFINNKVAALLEQLRVEFTKSRAYRTTDNALVEGKNGAVVRKHMGYGLFREASVRPINDFYRKHFNIYLNFHRPCGFATVTTDDRGRRRRHYKGDDYCTPYEKLKSLDNWEKLLKPTVTRQELERQASAISDIEAAQAMQQAKWKLYGQAMEQTVAAERGKG